MSHPKQSMARQGVHGFALARLVLEVFREHCSYETTASCASEIGNRVAAQLVRHEHESPFFVDPTISEFLEGFASILISPATYATEFPTPQDLRSPAEAETPTTDPMIHDLEFAKSTEVDNNHQEGFHEQQQRAKSGQGDRKRPTRIACPLCFEIGVPQTLSRSQDFSRHCEICHLRKKWPCPSCSEIYTKKQALCDHYTKNHPGKDIFMDFHPKSSIQKVFACGVKGCTSVFRTPDEEAAFQNAKGFFNHLKNHFTLGMKHIEGWDYSTTMRNLLRPLMDKAGVAYDSIMNDLQFDKNSSEDLQERLENADFRDDDTNKLIIDAVGRALQLRSSRSAQPLDKSQVPSSLSSNYLVNEVINGTIHDHRPTYNFKLGVQGSQTTYRSPDRTQSEPHPQPPGPGGQANHNHHTAQTNFSAAPLCTQKPPGPHSDFSAYYNPPHLPPGTNNFASYVGIFPNAPYLPTPSPKPYAIRDWTPADSYNQLPNIPATAGMQECDTPPYSDYSPQNNFGDRMD